MADIKLYGTLHNVTGEPVARANEIYDETQEKNQSIINANVEEAIGADDIPGSIKGRIKENETALEEGGSVDQRIAEEGAKHYLKNEIYNKTELNSMITTPNQGYVTVTATDQTTDVTDVLPATGSADTVYRVGNWDGTQYTANVYSEYAFEGSNYIFLSKKETGIDDEPTAGSDNLVKSGGVSQVSNGLNAKCGIFRKVFSVTAGYHSSNNDRAILSIPAEVPVTLCLKNITTSNSGGCTLYALFKGDDSPTYIINSAFDSSDIVIFDKDVEKLGYYWSASVGTTSGDVAIEVETYDEGREYSYNPFNIAAFIANGADFVWTDAYSSTITINDNIAIKHLIRNNRVIIKRIDVLASAEEATGFSVSGNNITFPGAGTMYYDTKTQTIGFVNNTLIADNDRYIALFENNYASYKRGLLVDYMIAKRFNAIDVLANEINNLNAECDNIKLYIKPVNVRLTTSKNSYKYYPITIKQGEYSIKNNGSSITSLYLCSSVSDPANNRVVTIGAIASDATVNFIVERDDIVCIDGWWPADTNFQIICHDSIQDLIKTKQSTTLIGQNEIYVTQQFTVKSNSVYRVIPSKTEWPVATNTKTYGVNAFGIKVNDVQKYYRLIASGSSSFSPLDSYIDIEIPDLNDSSTVQIGFRAVANEEVYFELIDVTSLISMEPSLFRYNPAEIFDSRVKTLKKQTPYGFHRVNTPLVLLWFSDLHNDLNNLERISFWKERYSSYIDDVLNTGDTIRTTLASYDEDMNAYFEDYGGDKILLTMGNHDVTSPNSSHMAWDGTQSITDMYTKYIGRLDANALGITQPTNAAVNGYCYYYKDYAGLGISTSGIRLIVIDSCITDADYQTTQVAWFVETLADAKTLGYDVIVASHYMPIGCNEFDNAKGFCYWIKEYRGGVGGDVSVDERFITAIDNFINSNGKFVTWLCGHTHADHVGIVPNHNNQMVIGITSASSNTYNPIDVMPVRVGKAQDAFDMIEVDTYYKQVKLVRVGYNIDALGREINMIVLDYQNKKVII